MAAGKSAEEECRRWRRSTRYRQVAAGHHRVALKEGSYEISYPPASWRDGKGSRQ